MKITEVYALAVAVHERERIYAAWEAENVMSAGGPGKWYEVSLVSPNAQKFLEENAVLEFGEEAAWTEEMFDESVQVFESLCGPASYIVKKMDGMGFYGFSQDAEGRKKEMEALERERLETERARKERDARKEIRRKELEERRKLIAEQRGKVQADKFLSGFQLPGEEESLGDNPG